MAWWIRFTAGCTLALSGLVTPGSGAWAQNVQIASLTDVSFGTIASVATNRTASQTLCVYSGVTNYTIRATGSGTSGAFTIGIAGNSAAQLPYTVQWASTGSQTAGTQLIAGQGSRFTPNPLNLLCSLGSLLASSASLIVTLPATNLSAALAGNYTGTLSLMVSPN